MSTSADSENTRPDLAAERLVAVIGRSARLIFAGLVLVSVALAFVAFRPSGGTAGASDIFLSRDLHYAAIVAIVAVYVYAQRAR